VQRLVATKSLKERRVSSHVATRPYRPPEIALMEREYHCSVDVWSLGCVLANLCSVHHYCLIGTWPD